MTATSDLPDRADSRGRAFDHFLTKPVRLDQIASLLGGRSPDRRATRPQSN